MVWLERITTLILDESSAQVGVLFVFYGMRKAFAKL
jgi:hypothetical protein